MPRYDPAEIEPRWRAQWEAEGAYRTPAHPEPGSTFYCLNFFPYPSGAGLSVGHGRNYVPTDVVARHARMRGRAVLYPMGWDAFGLPAENEAITRNVHPRTITRRYAANYRRQLALLGCSYDWEREIDSSEPEFYRWTQWFFLLLYRHGLAYRARGRQWYCPGCRTTLANEQVDATGTCWRGHTGVYKRDLEQWYFRITAYADELLAGLEELDWPEHVLAMQRHWIGRSEGAEIDLAMPGRGETITVFTTRPDTLPGVTFVALAPEHPLALQIAAPERQEEVARCAARAAQQGDVERQAGEANGVFTGAYALHPVSGEPLPVYLAEYVLSGYGTGAVMGVPAHDERDYAFATRYGIPIRPVIIPVGGESPAGPAYAGAGTLANAGQWDGMPSGEAAQAIVRWLAEHGRGRSAVRYKMRDWLISRQRYWGAPIPIVYCDGCGEVPVPEAELPVLLPEVEVWRPGGDGQSPLAAVPEFVHTRCPACGGPARRETDTMDGFACSSWYFLRFVSPHYAMGPFDPAALAAWGRPDLYVGGAEHAVMHLLYARMWTRVIADAGLIGFREPFPVLRNQGVMHGRDGNGEIRRMSKSSGNVVTPDEVAAKWGADSLRLHLLFMAPFDHPTNWDEAGLEGCRRFLERAWRLAHQAGQARSPAPDPAARAAANAAIRRVSSDVEAMKFNTAIAVLMECSNALAACFRERGATADLAWAVRSFILLLAPFAPYIAEELWTRMGGSSSVHHERWPEPETDQEHVETVQIVVQVDGKVRGSVCTPAGADTAAVEAAVMSETSVVRALAGRRPQRIVHVPGRLVNLVTR